LTGKGRLKNDDKGHLNDIQRRTSHFLVIFQVEKVLPLIGAGREEDTLY